MRFGSSLGSTLLPHGIYAVQFLKSITLTLLAGMLVIQGSAQDLKSEIDPRARVSAFSDDGVPDHIGQPVGPPPRTLGYEGALEPGNIYRMEANPSAGFHWPYFLFVPPNVKSDGPILIEPNNDGLWGAPFETHEYWAAIRNEQLYVDFGRELGTPMLTPVFPRPLVDDANGNLYIHALTRAAMISEDERYARPDLQLIAMFDDARAKLATSGHDTPEDALFWGFSAAADFVTRMAILQPTRVRAVVAGGIGGFPILPQETFDGEILTFPVGTADLASIADNALDAEALRDTSMLLFQGSIDENDSVPEPPINCDNYGSDSYSCEQAIFVNSRFGASTVDRVPLVAEAYTTFGMHDFNYLILPGIEHWTPKAFEDVMRTYFVCIIEAADGCATKAQVPDLSSDLAEQSARLKE